MRMIVHDGETVVNVVTVDEGWTGSDGEWQPAEGFFAVAHETAQIGWPVGGGGASGAPVPPAKPPQDLASLKAFAREMVVTRANLVTQPVLSRYPAAERAGWDKKEAEARAIVAASDKAAAIAATSVIKVLAAVSGENTAATVVRAEAIIARADEFTNISAAGEVFRDASLAAIDLVTDPDGMEGVLATIEADATALAAQVALV